MKAKKTIKKMIDRAIDKSVPDTVITTYRRTSYNSRIDPVDCGHFWKDFNTPNVGGLALVRRLAAIHEATNSQAARVVGAA
jgi:hypothetical protein